MPMLALTLTQYLLNTNVRVRKEYDFFPEFWAPKGGSDPFLNFLPTFSSLPRVPVSLLYTCQSPAQRDLFGS